MSKAEVLYKRAEEIRKKGKQETSEKTVKQNVEPVTSSSSAGKASALYQRANAIRQKSASPSTVSRIPVGSGISSRDDWYRVYQGRVGTQQAKYKKLKTLLDTMDDYDIADADKVKKDITDQLAEIEASPEYKNAAYSRKHAGKSSAQLSTLAKQATDPDEAAWLEYVSKATMTDEDYKYLLARETEELSRLEEMFSKKQNTGSLLWNAIGKRDLAQQYGYGSWKEAQDRYATLQREMYFLESGREYDEIPTIPGFEQASKVNTAYSTDDAYSYINNIDGFRNRQYSGALSGGGANKTYAGYDKMTDYEIGTYNAIYATEGKESAKKYLDYLSYSLSERDAQEARENAEYFSKKAPVLSDVMSTPMNLIGGVEGAVDVLGQKITQGVTGQYKPIDFKQGTLAAQAGSAIRGYRSEQLNNLSGTIQIDAEKNPVLSRFLNGKGVGDLYQLGMSMVDSGAAAGISAMTGTGWLGGALLGTSSGTQAMIEAANSGATDSQAIWTGITNGAFEMLFEKVSIDRLLSYDGKNIIKSILTQGAVEGSEEAATSVANTLADFFIMAADSEWAELVDQYMAAGDDPETAKWKALRDKAVDIAYDFAAGALTGGIMSGGASAVQGINNRAIETSLYRESAPDLVAKSRELGGKTAIADRVQEQIDAGKKVSGRDLRALVKSNDTAIATQAATQAETMLTERGETENVAEVAKVVGKMIAGQELSRSEMRIFRESQNAAEVYDAMQTDEATTESATTTAVATAESVTDSAKATRTAQETQIPAPVEVEGTVQNIAPAAEFGQETAIEETTGQEIAETTQEEEVDADELAPYADQYANPAAYRATFQASQDAAKYDVAYRAAYEMGLSGVPVAQMMRSNSVSYLEEGQRVDAFREGEQAAKFQAAQQDAALKTAEKRTGERKRGYVKAEGGVNIKTLTEKFNDSQRKAYRILDRIADVTGINIVLYESKVGDDGRFEGEQGRFQRSTPDTIYIDINAGLSGVSDVGDMAKYTMLATFSHEFTHFCEAWNPIRYNELRKLVFDTMESKNESAEDRIDSMMAGDKSLTREAASREVVAEALSEILPDANFVEQLATKHKSLFQKFLEQLKEFVESIREIFSGMPRSKATAVLQEELEGTVRYMDSIVKLFDNVAVEAVERMQESKAVEGVEDTTEQKQRRRVEEENFANELDAWSRGELPEDMTFVLDSTGEVLQGLGAIESDIYINGSKIKEITQEHPEMTLAEIKKIPQILRNPTLVLKSGNDIGKTEKNTRLLLLGTVKATNGQPIMIILDLRPKEEHLIIENMQKVNSAYTKTRSPVRYIRNSQIVYADKNKTTKLLRSIGFQMPTKLQQSGYIGSISYYQRSVKVQGVPFSEVVLENNVTQLQRRPTNRLSDREVLTIAAETIGEVNWTPSEKGTLEIFRKRLAEMEPLQEQIDEQESIAASLATRDPEEAQKAKNRAATLKGKLTRATTKLLEAENSVALRRILEKARRVAEKSELQAYRATRQESELAKRYKARIEKDVNELINWSLKPDTKNAMKHIPEGIKGPVLDFLEAIDFSSKRKLAGGADTQKDERFLGKMEALKKALEPMRPNGEENLEKTRLSDEFFDRLDKLSDNITRTAQEIHSFDAGVIINEMGSEDLKRLAKIIKGLKQLITEYNRTYKNAIFASIDKAGENSVETMQKMKPLKSNSVTEFLEFDQTRPAYIFERFGEGGKSIWQELQNGQSRFGFMAKEIIDFSEKTYTAKEVKTWEKEVKTIKLSDDSTVEMTIAQIMSLYKLQAREQALGHLLGNGIRIPNYKIGGKKYTDNGHFLNREDIDNICSVLTARQKIVADKLQNFMQETGSQWGNEVTMVRFGERLFGKKNYFPIHSDGGNIPGTLDEHLESQSLYAMLNMGFTKRTQEGANNRIIVHSIFDEYAAHMSSMAKYNAFALPVLDTLRWLNYTDAKNPNVGVRQEMARVYGRRTGSDKATAELFVTNLLKALNGTENAPIKRTEQTAIRFLGRYNRAQVAANLSVAIQQPLSVIRSTEEFGVGSLFVAMGTNAKAIRKNWKEMEEHSGIAVWKQLGFYDINISRGLSSMIKHDESAVDKMTEWTMGAASFADRLTWGWMWEIAKQDVKKKKNLKPSDNGYWETVTQAFEDVIFKTQVVDSPLTKTEAMRNNSFWAKSVYSFMSEPITALSMNTNAVSQFRRGLAEGKSMSDLWRVNGKKMGRTFMVSAVSLIFNAAVTAALRDALRDDDEYENYGEKFMQAFRKNLFSELTPLSNIPELSGLVNGILLMLKDTGAIGGEIGESIFEEKSTTESILEAITNAVYITYKKIWGKGSNYTWYGAVYNALKAASGITGLPVASGIRDLITMWNNTMAPILGKLYPKGEWVIRTYEPDPKQEIRAAYQNGYLADEEALEAMKEEKVSVPVTYKKTPEVAYKGYLRYWSYKQAHPKDESVDDTWFIAYGAHGLDAAGVKLDTYLDYRKKAKAKKNERKTWSEEKQDETSEKEVLLDLIDSMNLTSKQKDTLYAAEGWSPKTIDEAPWH